jgi:multiple sugar transport system permease protein
MIYLTLTVPLAVWVLTGFFGSLPIEIDRAARVDGCSRMQFLRHVFFPMALPGIAAAAVLAFLTSWNEFLFALLLASGSGLFMLPPSIAAPLFGTGSDVELMVAIATIAIIPPIIAAFFLQKYILRLRIVDPISVGAG